MVGGRDADYWANVAAGRVNLATGPAGSGGRPAPRSSRSRWWRPWRTGISPHTVFPAPASITAPAPGGGTCGRSRTPTVRGYGTLSLEHATIEIGQHRVRAADPALGAETVVETATRMGLRCCTDVARAHHALLAVDTAVLGIERGQHPGDGVAPTAPSPTAAPRCAHAGQSRHRRPGETICAGRSRAEAGRRPAGGVGRPTASCRRSCCTARARTRTSGGRRSARPAPTTTTTTRGSSAPSPSSPRRCGWDSRGADPDGAAAYADHRLRWYVARADLAPVHAEGDGEAPRRAVPHARGAVHGRGRRHDPAAGVPSERVHPAQTTSPS